MRSCGIDQGHLEGLLDVDTPHWVLKNQEDPIQSSYLAADGSILQTRKAATIQSLRQFRFK